MKRSALQHESAREPRSGALVQHHIDHLTDTERVSPAQTTRVPAMIDRVIGLSKTANSRRMCCGSRGVVRRRTSENLYSIVHSWTGKAGVETAASGERNAPVACGGALRETSTIMAVRSVVRPSTPLSK